MNRIKHILIKLAGVAHEIQS